MNNMVLEAVYYGNSSKAPFIVGNCSWRCTPSDHQVDLLSYFRLCIVGMYLFDWIQDTYKILHVDVLLYSLPGQCVPSKCSMYHISTTSKKTEIDSDRSLSPAFSRPATTFSGVAVYTPLPFAMGRVLEITEWPGATVVEFPLSIILFTVILNYPTASTARPNTKEYDVPNEIILLL